MVNFLRKNNKITEVHELRNCQDRRDVCTFHLLFNPLTFDIRFLWDNSTPFGFPVVPENENDERRVEWSKNDGRMRVNIMNEKRKRLDKGEEKRKVEEKIRQERIKE